MCVGGWGKIAMFASVLQKVQGIYDDILFKFCDAVHTESCPSP